IPYLLEETTRCVILHNYDVVDPNCTLLAAEAEEEANLIDLKSVACAHQLSAHLFHMNFDRIAALAATQK
ncbi:hypothetical protein KBD59_06030, partial [Candidatus Gracilibacteria bacterium]|nr:hypothetical protein [Candidatus Gracilibacteria bacterium]